MDFSFRPMLKDPMPLNAVGMGSTRESRKRDLLRPLLPITAYYRPLPPIYRLFMEGPVSWRHMMDYSFRPILKDPMPLNAAGMGSTRESRKRDLLRPLLPITAYYRPLPPITVSFLRGVDL